jgi:hypothetical protein
MPLLHPDIERDKSNDGCLVAAVIIIFSYAVIRLVFFSAPTPTQGQTQSSVTPRFYWDHQAGLTSAQQDSFDETLVGKRVRWNCSVSDVASSGRMSVECETNTFMFYCYASFRVPSEHAEDFNVGQQISFSGTISRVGSLCTFSLEDVVITDTE